MVFRFGVNNWGLKMIYCVYGEMTIYKMYYSILLDND
ncbi:Uncharacterised protein [Streptococcus pneumoniae]|nr:Uncharacterised protein [Streptococcus pneumoniae]CJW18289.1 Uncharacterised protein [Streptococcus pneumoniae]